MDGQTKRHRILAFLSGVFVIVLASGSLAQQERARIIRKSEFGDQWPFSISEGIIMCYPADTLVFMTADKREFAVNGNAKEMFTFMTPVEAIIRRRTNGSAVGNIRIIIHEGLKLCAR